ncbi:MAG TPA: hypothetical protein VHS32_16525 [Streptosporangiaceae bacterium]|jgi:hypothetical protein|nr:hypothetical protein [Streptosporangiaceae bacterium]HEX3307854.1 hypothetical protein [Streptosporangiaceae bacterium]
MTVHDLERLRRAPFRLILPSCESGLLVPAGADELLGLAPRASWPAWPR